MKTNRSWIVVAIVFAIGIAIGIVAANPPKASAAGDTTVTVYIDTAQYKYTGVLSHIVDDDGMLRIKLENDEHIFNEEHWTRVHITTAQ